MEFHFTAGSYSMFFRLQLGRAYKMFGPRLCNSEHDHGWDKKPSRFQSENDAADNLLRSESFMKRKSTELEITEYWSEIGENWRSSHRLSSSSRFGSRISFLRLSIFATMASFYVAGRMWPDA
ncbi:hypothetical protein CASFOL_007652 [Castilleja foliolosa]|uniref:Uncharacterized protein n=1 Tax=Castilleja foliolosa TaxID=1961234 RepID=A0ABD3E1F9_9LAMI